MKIQEVTIEGYQSHTNSTFRLSPGLTVITGPSDAGKTAIIRALRWFAFNEPTGEAFLHTIRNPDGSVKEAVDQVIAGLENVAANIHSRSGRLAQSYTVGGNENIFDVQAGGGSASVRYGSNCPYAVPAEEGYNQSNRVSKSTGRKPSLWVPGSGSGSNFSYNPGAKTGMKLSGRFVPGQHMFEKSLPDTKEDLRKITKSEVERLFRALF